MVAERCECSSCPDGAARAALPRRRKPRASGARDRRHRGRSSRAHAHSRSRGRSPRSGSSASTTRQRAVSPEPPAAFSIAENAPGRHRSTPGALLPGDPQTPKPRPASSGAYSTNVAADRLPRGAPTWLSVGRQREFSASSVRIVRCDRPPRTVFRRHPFGRPQDGPEGPATRCLHPRGASGSCRPSPPGFFWRPARRRARPAPMNDVGQAPTPARVRCRRRWRARRSPPSSRCRARASRSRRRCSRPACPASSSKRDSPCRHDGHEVSTLTSPSKPSARSAARAACASPPPCGSAPASRCRGASSRACPIRRSSGRTARPACPSAR